MHPLHSPSSFGGRKVNRNEYVLLGICVFCIFPHKSRYSLVKKWTVLFQALCYHCFSQFISSSSNHDMKSNCPSDLCYKNWILVGV